MHDMDYQAKQGQKDFDTEKQQHNWGIRPLRDLELLVTVGHWIMLLNYLI